MIYFVFLYGMIFYTGQWASDKIGRPCSITLAAMILFFLAACFVYEKKIGFSMGSLAHKNWLPMLPMLLWPMGNMALLLGGCAQVTESFCPWALTVVCGMVEELAFRGWLWEKTRTWKPMAAAIGNGLLFGLFHCANLTGAPLAEAALQVFCAACVGFALCGVTAYFGSVLPAACLHGCINLTGGGISVMRRSAPAEAAVIALSLGSILWGIRLLHSTDAPAKDRKH